jgi:uncharacterized membrane protein
VGIATNTSEKSQLPAINLQLPITRDLAAEDALNCTVLVGGIALLLVWGAYGIVAKIAVIPISTLYPVVTVVLAFLFLHEQLPLTRPAGIALAAIARWLLIS